MDSTSPSCKHCCIANDVNKDGGHRGKNASSSFQVVSVMEAMDFVQQEQCQLKGWEQDSSTSSSAPTLDSFLEKLSIVKCTSCDKSVGLLLGESFQSLQQLLHDETKLVDGWSKVASERERLALFILNQIIYREYEVPDEDELQGEYAFPSEADFTKILWNKGNAVGFYSVKPKGSLDQESMQWYRMTVLDTIFIRDSERRKGNCLRAIEDIMREFPGESIGFSVPISLPMIQVLKKYLESHPEHRMKLWEIDGCGLEGNCQILWYLLKRR